MRPSARPTLYLRPLNGLCNRMRAIAAARALAADTPAKLVVAWGVGDGLGARFDDLFLSDGSFEVLTPRNSVMDALTYLACAEMDNIRGVPTRWITRLAFGDRILRNLRPEDFTDADLRARLCARGRLLISSWWSFYGGNDVDYSFFTPRSAEREMIDRYSVDFSQHTIGVHIRRTDNANAIKLSPTSAFISAMKAAVDREARVNFYLATDCEATEQELVSIFGTRLITRPREMSRDSLTGMRDAIVDLYLLSRTKQIYGSYYSTFSETAASIGRIGWVTVTDDPSVVDECNSEVLLMEKAYA